MAMRNYVSCLCVGATTFATDIWTFRFQFMVPVYFLMIWSKQFMYEAVQTTYWIIRTKDDSLRGQNSGFLQSTHFTYLYSTSFCKVFVHFSSFMVTLCICDIQHFIVQLTHTTLKNIKLLKHFKIKDVAPTCFGLQGNHHQGATAST